MDTFSLCHFATKKANYTFLAQTVNRKRPFTRRIENRPKPTPPPWTVRFAVREPYINYATVFAMRSEY